MDAEEVAPPSPAGRFHYFHVPFAERDLIREIREQAKRKGLKPIQLIRMFTLEGLERMRERAR